MTGADMLLIIDMPTNTLQCVHAWVQNHSTLPEPLHNDKRKHSHESDKTSAQTNVASCGFFLTQFLYSCMFPPVSSRCNLQINCPICLMLLLFFCLPGSWRVSCVRPATPSSFTVLQCTALSARIPRPSQVSEPRSSQTYQVSRKLDYTRLMRGRNSQTASSE